MGYTHVCVSEMLDHLLDQCHAITDTEKAEKLEAKRLSKEKKERKKGARFRTVNKKWSKVVAVEKRKRTTYKGRPVGNITSNRLE